MPANHPSSLASRQLNKNFADIAHEIRTVFSAVKRKAVSKNCLESFYFGVLHEHVFTF